MCVCAFFVLFYSLDLFLLCLMFVVCLLFSLIESMFILPSHLSHAKLKPVDKPENILAKVRAVFSGALESLANRYYRKFLEKTLVKNGNTLVFFLKIFCDYFWD